MQYVDMFLYLFSINASARNIVVLGKIMFLSIIFKWFSRAHYFYFVHRYVTATQIANRFIKNSFLSNLCQQSFVKYLIVINNSVRDQAIFAIYVLNLCTPKNPKNGLA